MCSFYNPNIGITFEESKSGFVLPRWAGTRITLVFDAVDKHVLSALSSISDASQLEFRRVEGAFAGNSLSELLSNITLEVLISGVGSFDSYIDKKLLHGIENDYSQLYLENEISDLIDVLLSYPEVDNDYVALDSSAKGTTTFLTLYERLHLCNHIKQHASFKILPERSVVSDKEFRICLEITV